MGVNLCTRVEAHSILPSSSPDPSFLRQGLSLSLKLEFSWWAGSWRASVIFPSLLFSELGLEG